MFGTHIIVTQSQKLKKNRINLSLFSPVRDRDLELNLFHHSALMLSHRSKSNMTRRLGFDKNESTVGFEELSAIWG